jgi:ribulose bisphosphate carboxylase small subunit
MVEEQSRIQRSQLAQEYLSGVVPSPSTFGNGKQEINPPTPSPQTTASLLDYSQATQMLPPNGAGQTALAEVERLLENAIRQGGRLSIEVASKREKAGNVWRSWPWNQEPSNATKAIESLMDCIQRNPNRFVKLIGYNPQTQKRLLEEIVVRP